MKTRLGITFAILVAALVGCSSPNGQESFASPQSWELGGIPNDWRGTIRIVRGDDSETVIHRIGAPTLKMPDSRDSALETWTFERRVQFGEIYTQVSSSGYPQRTPRIFKETAEIVFRDGKVENVTIRRVHEEWDRKVIGEVRER